MNKNLLIVLAGGFVIAIIVALIVQAGMNKEPQVADANTVQILAASKNISMGSKIDATDMKWQAWPETAVFTGAIVREGDQSETNALEGRASRDIASGEPLTLNSVLSTNGGNIVASSLEPGKRAIAIRVSPESMVGGFVNPGNHVDVILTHRIRLSGGDKSLMRDTVNQFATETVLENVRVLAIDQRATNTDEDKAKVGRTVTLEVSAPEAEKVAIASEMGDLSLSLRPVGDTSRGVTESGVTTDVGVSRVLQEMTKRSNEGGSNSRTIRVYSGSGAETIKVRQ